MDLCDTLGVDYVFGLPTNSRVRRHVKTREADTKKHYEKHQRFPPTLKLAGLAANLGARHELVVLVAQQYYSGGCLVGGTTVKGGMSFV